MESSILLNCLIIEDEPLASDVLEDYVRQVPALRWCATCRDAITAMRVLREQRIDLIFLDLHLPKLKGLDFLQVLGHAPLVIVTTAYEEYALASYEHSVLDYLLKPIEFKRFLAATNKALAQHSRLHQTPYGAEIFENTREQAIFVHQDRKKVRIPLSNIHYLESQREYVKIVTTDRIVVTKCTLATLEAELPPERFLRVHRSFVVAVERIEAITAQDVEIAGMEIPIGRTYRDVVAARLGA